MGVVSGCADGCFQAALMCAGSLKTHGRHAVGFSGCLCPTIGGFGKCEYAVDARLLHGFGESGKVGAVGAMGKGFNQHGSVEPCNHAGLLGDNEFERGVAGGGAEYVGEYQRAVVGRGAGKVGLGALDDGGVVVAWLDVQLVDVAKIAVGQDVVSKGGVGGAEGFVGNDEQVYHGLVLCVGSGDKIGSLKTVACRFSKLPVVFLCACVWIMRIIQ